MPPEITAMLSAILGACAGGLIGFWSARYAGWLNARAAAASSLRGAFGPHLYGLSIDNKTAGMLMKNLISDFPMNARQMDAFGFFVSSKHAADYQKACEEYAKLVRDHQNANRPDTPTHVFRDRINAILSFPKI